MKRILLIGCTGSIGTQTIDVVKNLRQQGYDISITGLVLGHNIDKVIPMIEEWLPETVGIIDAEAAKKVSSLCKEKNIKLFSGKDAAVLSCENTEYDLCVNAAVGIAGLQPSYMAIRHGADVALANKETIVTDGMNFLKEAQSLGRKIIPLDSEHSAIFQCLSNGERKDIEKLLITASGGPFYGRRKSDLKYVTPEQTLNHPNWSMGKKITVDSATLINKGFEVIEAARLFDIDPEKIGVLIHRESIVHSMVEYQDGTVIAQLGVADMRIPIQYGLTYPARPMGCSEKLDLAKIGKLSFSEPDEDTFNGFKLCKNALKQGGNATAIINSADEVAVQLFLDKKIGFCDIPVYLEKALNTIPFISNPTTEEIIDTDRRTRDFLIKLF